MGGAGGSASKDMVLYDSGSWGISYENPGNYAYTGVSVGGALLESADIKFVSESNAIRLIGSSNKIDLTNYSMLKVRAKATNANLVACISNTKTVSSGTVKSMTIQVSAEYTEFVLDVTSLSGEYYFALWTLTSYNNTTYVDKIWLV